MDELKRNTISPEEAIEKLEEYTQMIEGESVNFHNVQKIIAFMKSHKETAEGVCEILGDEELGSKMKIFGTITEMAQAIPGESVDKKKKEALSDTINRMRVERIIEDE